MDMSLNNYNLRCELLGHSMDVRAVTTGKTTNDGEFIVSGSRDKTAKIWKPVGNEYVEFRTFSDHKNFVASVYYLDDEKWVVTGSNDATICLYQVDSYVNILTLKGHESTVCAISKGIEQRSIISGSWDKTGRIWYIDDCGGYKVTILRGHEAAVWAVASMPKVQKFITGSADKCIYYWNVKGEKLRMLTGHTDCVRGVIALSDNTLISCANDAVIKYWSEDGECIKELTGHTNYIYSVCQNTALSENIIVSCGEDSSLRMWNISTGEELGDPIIHPAQSVWAVTCLSNGDIVTAGSDGVIRVFTQNPTNFANAGILNTFQMAVATRKAQLQENIGSIKKTELPGPESLLIQGKAEGQTKMVRNSNGSVQCYSWESGKWNLIGEVVGAGNESSETSKKTLYNGKEYDFVFSVDVSDTEPPKKLPYNIGEDPWQVAQTFIHRNNLPQSYLDQVANFIITNSKTNNKNQPNQTPNFKDPFTGSSRYTPGTGSSNVNQMGNVDPFTGTSSYSTTKVQESNQHLTEGNDFPKTKYTTFDKCDPSKVLDKLKEFNNRVQNGSEKVSDTLLETVVRLSDDLPETDTTSIDALKVLLSWPKDILFPVLDITRLAIRNETIFELLNNSNFIDEIILPQLHIPIVANQLMAARCLANMMVHESGRKEFNKKIEAIMNTLHGFTPDNTNTQIAVATFYFNASVEQVVNGSAQNSSAITNATLQFFSWVTDPEASYRTMQAIGNLLSTAFSENTTKEILNMKPVMEKIEHFAHSKQPESFSKLNSAGLALLKRLENV